MACTQGMWTPHTPTHVSEFKSIPHVCVRELLSDYKLYTGCSVISVSRLGETAHTRALCVPLTAETRERGARGVRMSPAARPGGERARRATTRTSRRRRARPRPPARPPRARRARGPRLVRSRRTTRRERDTSCAPPLGLSASRPRSLSVSAGQGGVVIHSTVTITELKSILLLTELKSS